ncbi:MAG: dihydrolipoyl dehydrogenase [Planctomycetales bacterium]|jgi:dihydrolipoamide dehydrogenase|nr:dihydrolipoyl dehydrogenase [Planctomycetales bacterium]
MADSKIELLVLGGGPGGYPAAFEAADHGLKVLLVDEGARPGGVCLNRGCIPSKALLHLAKLINESHDSVECGLTFGKPKIDLAKLRDFKNGVIGKLSGGISELCRARGVTLVSARGTFLDSHTIELKHPDGRIETIGFEKAIIATGSSPAIPPLFQLGDPRVMDSTGALELAAIPGSLLVVGGGYIGLEMGTVYAALGSKVTVVELTSGLLPGADRDLVKPLQKRLEKQFAALHLQTKVEALKATKTGIEATLTGEGVAPKQTFDRVLISIGRRPNSQGLGLEKTGVTVDEKGFITVDGQRRSTVPHIFAIGDIAGEPMLAHKATREAKVAVEAMMGGHAEFDNIAIPAVVFTDPEIAWCGLMEHEAAARNIEVKVVKFPWTASGRATTLARNEGLTKLIIDPKTERILGVGLVGVNAGEMIAEATLAVETAAVARDLAETIHAHPTLSETLMEAAESVFGQATHSYRPKR